ncbi:hypothetical protein Tco_1313846 [Tanacetum coccineum]
MKRASVIACEEKFLNDQIPSWGEEQKSTEKDQDEKSTVELLADERLLYKKPNQIKFNGLSIEIRKITQEAKEIRESEARARSRKIIIDDDDDDLGFYAVHPNTIHIPVSQNVEPKDSLIMGDGHINTTPETETNSVETLVSNPSESDDFSLGECNLFDIEDSFYEKSTSRLAHLAPLSPEIVEVCVDDDDTDKDDDYDDDFYDCVDIEEEGGEIDFDISKIVDISLREKFVESENVVLDEEEDTFTFTTRSFLPFVTYSEVLPTSTSRGGRLKFFNPGIFEKDVFNDKSSKELAPSKALLTLDILTHPQPP